MKSLLADANEARLVQLARTAYAADLTPGEMRVLRDSVQPGPAAVHPEDQTARKKVRADFLRWLLNDAWVRPLIDKDGIQIVGAEIEGQVDLDGTVVSHNLTLQECSLDAGLSCQQGQLLDLFTVNVTLAGGLDMQDVTCTGVIELTGLTCDHIHLYGAHVSGDVSLEGAVFNGDKDAAMEMSGADIRGVLSVRYAQAPSGWAAAEARFGSAVLASGLKAGNVALTGSTFAESLYFDGAKLAGSLRLDDSQIAGTLGLGLTNDDRAQNFQCAGPVSLSGVTVKQQVVVEGAQLQALNANSAQIGTLLWFGIVNPRKTSLTLDSAKLGTLLDEKRSWPDKGSLVVKGLTYDRIALDVPETVAFSSSGYTMHSIGTEPDDRMAWLLLQTEEDKLIAQPWIELSEYVKAQGNPEGAKRVQYVMRRLQARHDRLPMRTLSFLYDQVEEDPLRVALPVFLFWVCGWIVFWRAHRMAAMSPTDKDAYTHFQEHGVEPPHYPPFTAVIYALENVLPVVKLGQDSAWAPNPDVRPPRRHWKLHWVPRMTYGWLAALRWLLIVTGWLLALILAGTISDRFKAQ